MEIVRGLTYEQLLLLGIFAVEENGAPNWASTGGLSWTSLGVVMAIFDLAKMGLVQRKDGQPIISFTDINPAEIRTIFNGTILNEAMGLEEAPRADLEAVVRRLDRLGKIVLGEENDPQGEIRDHRIRLKDLPEPRFPLTEMLAAREKD